MMRIGLLGKLAVWASAVKGAKSADPRRTVLATRRLMGIESLLFIGRLLEYVANLISVAQMCKADFAHKANKDTHSLFCHFGPPHHSIRWIVIQ
jgi:hypothetical protein